MRAAILVCMPVLITACAGSPDRNRIGGLDRPVEIRKDRQVAPPEQDAAVVRYSRFVRLFEAIPDESMRSDGLRRLTRLQQQAEGDASMQDGQIPLQQVTRLFEELLGDYPDQRNDRLLYQLSRAYDESGEQAAALHSLDRLVSLYPDTRTYDEAQFRRGEILFSARDYAKAQQAYAAVVALGRESRLYQQAYYKLGWSRFKQSDYEQALDAFTALLDLHIDSDRFDINELAESEATFVDDIFRATSLCFAYQAGAVSADAYLSARRPRVYEHMLFRRLAEFYLAKKHYADSVKAYRTFVERNPNDHRAPLYLMRVIDIYEQGGFDSLLLAARKDFVQRYGIRTDFWNTQGSDRLQPVVAALRQNLQVLARHYHARSQDGRSQRDFREAQRWYRAYLASFPDDEQAADMNFMFADLLYAAGDYRGAVLEYEKIAYDYSDYGRSAEAGYAALQAYDQQVSSLSGRALEQWQYRFIDSALRFAERFARHEQAAVVLGRAAEDSYNLGDHERAHRIAGQVLERSDDAPLQASAWLLIAHTEFHWQAFGRAELAYEKALAFMPADDPRRADIMEKQGVAVYKQGEMSRDRGDLEGAVSHFGRVGQYAAAGGLVASAEYDQAAALIGLRQWDKAAQVLEAFRKTHPEHELQGDATRKLAVVYMQNGEQVRAAAAFENLSRLPGDRDYRMESLWQAAELYEQANRNADAKKTYKDFIERFPQPLERAVEARQRLVELYQRDPDARAVRHWQEDIIRVHESAGDDASERIRYLAAKASFALAEPLFEQYRSVELRVPLKTSLARKKQRMQKALQAYQDCAAFEVAEVLTAATYRIAEIYQHLGLAIYNSERPTELNGEQLEQYDILLEEQAYPFEEKAIEFYEINAARLSEGLTGVWVRKSLDNLKQLLPVRYGKQERHEKIVQDIF